MLTTVKILNRKVVLHISEQNCIKGTGNKRLHHMISSKIGDKTYHTLGHTETDIGSHLLKILNDVSGKKGIFIPKIMKVIITAFDNNFDLEWPSSCSEAPLKEEFFKQQFDANQAQLDLDHETEWEALVNGNREEVSA